MNRILIIALFVFVYISTEPCIAQDQYLTKLYKIELGLQGLGIGHELPISTSLLTEFNVGLGGGISVNERELIYSYWPSVYANAAIRWYYSQNRRIERGKNMSNNAGNYLGFKTKFSSRALFERSAESFINYEFLNFPNNALVTEIHWGLQRNLGKRIFINAHLGLGYIQDFENSFGTISPTAGVKFNYRLNKSSIYNP